MTTNRKNILLVGANGLVGGDFKNAFKDKYSIVELNKNDSLSAVTSDIDAIIFTAQSGDYKNPIFTQDLFDVNVKLLHSVLLKFAGKAIKFINFSTGSVYKSEGEIVSEKSPLNHHSNSPYVASKLIGEELLSTFSGHYKSIFNLRPFFIYGKNQNPQMLMKTMFERVSTRQTISLSGDKGLIFNPIYVEDVTTYLDYLLSEESLSGYCNYNLCGNDVISLNEVVTWMGEICGQGVEINIQGDSNTLLVALSEISGWKPVVGIREGLKKTFGNG